MTSFEAGLTVQYQQSQNEVGAAQGFLSLSLSRSVRFYFY